MVDGLAGFRRQRASVWAFNTLARWPLGSKVTSARRFRMFMSQIRVSISSFWRARPAGSAGAKVRANCLSGSANLAPTFHQFAAKSSKAQPTVLIGDKRRPLSGLVYYKRIHIGRSSDR